MMTLLGRLVVESEVRVDDVDDDEAAFGFEAV
jgi:hypothetical protein